MRLLAKCHLATTILLGFGVLLWTVAAFQSVNPVRFCIYLGLAILSAGMKVKLPAINGTMSVNFFFILISILELSLPETVVIGCSSILVQCLWRNANRIKLVQVLFNLSSMAIASGTSWLIYCDLAPHILDYRIRLALSASSFFALNTMPVALIISLTEGRQMRKIWQECYFWSFPYYLAGGALAVLVSAMGKVVGWKTFLMVLPLMYWIYRSYRMYLDRLEDEKKHVEDMSSLHLRTIEALALAIEAKDQTTHGHLQRVEIYALEIGKELGLDEKELEALRAASLLHDVGKLAVPEHIISKPGRLTPEEFDKMKIHPVVGAEILECVQFPYPVVPIVRSHHEKWDGSGYPDGLAGEEIPIGARILSAVDCFDALSSDRQYRRALPQAAAMQVVLAESGRSFDPKVVAVLERRYEDLESRAQDSATTANRLSINVRVTRGDAPAAGFETTAAVDQGGAADFLTSIANAHEEAQGLFELTQEIGNSLSLDETLSVLALRLRRMVPHDCLAVYMIREGKLVPEFINGENSRLFASLEIPLGHGLSGWVAENRMPIVNGNPSVEPGYLNDRTKFSTLGSALAVPLEGLNGVIGTLALYHAGHNAFSKDHLRVLQAIVGKLALSVENAMKYRQAEKSATTDGLTGLPNARSLFLHLDSELSRCHRQSQPLSILVCDLDGFKQVNDRFGHLEGNRILQKVAAGFQEACRSYDYVARMGGDEFVVLLPGQAADQLAKKIERLREIAVRAGREVCGEDILDLSIGEAGYPGDGSSAEQLLAEADRRMYHNKHQNKALLRQGIIDRDFQAPVLVQ